MRIGQRARRVEDERLLRGAACFTADLRPGGAAEMYVLRSTVPAARITGLDAGAARRSPGVLAVLTGRDVVAARLDRFEPKRRHPAPGGGDMFIPDFRPLAVQAIHFVGQPIAAVIADTLAQAEDAAVAIRLDVEERPPSWTAPRRFSETRR